MQRRSLDDAYGRIFRENSAVKRRGPKQGRLVDKYVMKGLCRHAMKLSDAPELTCMYVSFC